MISKRDRVLVVARSLPINFSAEGLVVAVWRQDERFGLKGYESLYPDCNAVLSYLYGRKGLVKAGKIRRVGPKVFACVVQPQLETA